MSAQPFAPSADAGATDLTQERHSRPRPGELEQLFRRGNLSRRQFISGLAALGATGSTAEFLLGSQPEPARAQAPTPKYLVIIVLDAFRADYLSLHPMPALAALARSGASYDRAWVGQLESYTPVGHATISTGSMPRTHSVIGFEWQDPATGLERWDAWAAGTIAGDLDRDLRESGAPSIPLAIKAADPHAQVVSLSSEKVYAADAMGGWAADYTLYLRQDTPTSLAPAAVPGHLPPDDFLKLPGLHVSSKLHHFTDWDYLSAMMALAALDRLKPRVLMVNLPGTDFYGHKYGGSATPGVMKQVIAGQDRDIARIVSAYKRAGIFDQTLFVVTSDHGMVANTHMVSPASVVSAVKEAGGQYYFHTGGTAADLYLHDPKHARKVSARMLRMPNVAAAYYLSHSGGQYEYLPAPGLKLDPSVDAAYHYLLNTFAGPSAPTVVMPYRENTIGQTFPNLHGDHGGLNWGVQQIPLVISGPGVRLGIVSHHPARLVDIAPTVLRLMGIDASGAMDGTILADAVTDATADEVAAQDKLAAPFTAHQNALMGQAVDNTAQDRKARQHPPPPVPIQP
jgi:predicted AlkP superfamily pyrophosphatase or phosphodiesterase